MQAHFDSSEFEKTRADGKKTLKTTAIPTIFEHKTTTPRKLALKRSAPDSAKVAKNQRTDHTYCNQGKACTYVNEQGEEIDVIETTGKPTFHANIIIISFTIQGDDQQRCENCSHLQMKINELKKELKEMKRLYQKMKDERSRSEKKVHKIFGVDQIKALSEKSKVAKWSAVTIKKSLLIRFTCGGSGYNTLLHQGYPLPSERTLRRRIQHLPFQPGILHAVFNNLKVKVESMSEMERECCLTLDEMSLTAKIELDVGSGTIYGGVTLEGHHGIANHALVFMLGGITSRWKQTVAYHFTGSGINGTTLKDIILEIIKTSHKIGLHVIAVTSDMGSANRAMWRAFGISCTRNETAATTTHPFAEERPLYFLADVPHLLKNIKAAFITGHVFTLPEEICRKAGLPSLQANIEPLRDLADFQKDRDLKPAPKLNSDLLHPSHFNKMKVSNATRVISHQVST